MPGSSSLPPNVEGTVVTVGTFDGVHRGHQDVLARLVQRAQALGFAENRLAPRLAQALLAKGQYARLIALYGQASLTDPGSAVAVKVALAQALAAQGLALDARREIASALALLPNSVPALMAQARLQAAAGEVDAALDNVNVKKVIFFLFSLSSLNWLLFALSHSHMDSCSHSHSQSHSHSHSLSHSYFYTKTDSHTHSQPRSHCHMHYCTP